jgi:hypothetical protein
MSSQALIVVSAAVSTVLLAFWLAGGLVPVLFLAALVDLGLTALQRRRVRRQRTVRVDRDRG